MPCPLGQGFLLIGGKEGKQMVNGWSNKSKTSVDCALPICTLLLIIFFSGICVLTYEEAGAQSQVQGQPKESEVWEVTLKLGGQSCDVNSAESAVLHLREGIHMVDIESQKGYLIVAYDPEKVSPQQMVGAVGKKRGEDWFCIATVVKLEAK